MQNQLKDVLPGLKREGATGWIGVWSIIRLLEDGDPNADSGELKKLSIELIRMMMEEGFLMVSFSPEKSAYIPWEDQRAEAVARRVRREWDELGREPTLGEIGYLRFLAVMHPEPSEGGSRC